MRDFIKQFSHGHDIGEEGCAHLQAGLLDTYRAIVDSRGVQSVWEQTFGTFSVAGWGAGGVEANDLGFLQTVQAAIGEALAAH